MLRLPNSHCFYKGHSKGYYKIALLPHTKVMSNTIVGENRGIGTIRKIVTIVHSFAESLIG